MLRELLPENFDVNDSVSAGVCRVSEGYLSESSEGLCVGELMVRA